MYTFVPIPRGVFQGVPQQCNSCFNSAQIIWMAKGSVSRGQQGNGKGLESCTLQATMPTPCMPQDYERQCLLD